MPFSEDNNHFLMLLAASNLGLVPLHKWAEALQPLVSIGQIAVALVTVIYILRKIKLLKHNSKK
jgi:hypothetical protein